MNDSARDSSGQLPNSSSSGSNRSISGQSTEPGETIRCPQCDSVVDSDATTCLICGADLPEVPAYTTETQREDDSKPPSSELELPSSSTEEDSSSEDRVSEDSTLITSAKDTESSSQTPSVVSTVKNEPSSDEEKKIVAVPTGSTQGSFNLRSCSLSVLIAIFVGIVVIGSWMILRYQGPELHLALVPTASPLPPTTTNTPTATIELVETDTPIATATATATPLPTETPLPPRTHTVNSGENLTLLSLIYRVSAESIAEASNVSLDESIFSGQVLQVPWPSPTPPLESVLLDINGQSVMVDVEDCEIIEIHEGDSIFYLAAQRNIPPEAIITVNRLTDQTIEILRPGDTLCLPRIEYTDTLPPTPGPSPTPEPTDLPSGPPLLSPVYGTEIDAEAVNRLQWVALQDLAADEWYMVEVIDLDDQDSLPLRGFTRDTAFKLQSSWRPQVPESRRMQWRVSIVRVTDERADGTFVYEYGGESSDPSEFFWLGAYPTPTPTATSIPTPTDDGVANAVAP